MTGTHDQFPRHRPDDPPASSRATSSSSPAGRAWGSPALPLGIASDLALTTERQLPSSHSGCRRSRSALILMCSEEPSLVTFGCAQGGSRTRTGHGSSRRTTRWQKTPINNRRHAPERRCSRSARKPRGSERASPGSGAIVIGHLPLMSSGNNAGPVCARGLPLYLRSPAPLKGDRRRPQGAAVPALSQLSLAQSRAAPTQAAALLSDTEGVRLDQAGRRPRHILRLQQVLALQSSEDRGLAEVILAEASHLLAGQRRKTLPFLKRFAKFADLAPQHDQSRAAA